MLLSFRFANHRSFRDEQQLNLTPVYDEGRGPSQSRSVPVAGIFGSNASGKSNALHALSYMRGLALRSDREVEPGLGLARDAFRLDAQSVAEPSRYVVDLSLSNIRYTYGFTLDNERVLEEWLNYYPLNRERRVFARDLDSFSFGEESGKNTDLQRIAEITAPTAMLLSTAARFSPHRIEGGRDLAEPLIDVYQWFQRFRSRVRPGLRARTAGPFWPDSKADRAVIVSLLRAADIGLVDVKLKPSVQESLFEVADAEVDASESPPRRLPRESTNARRRLQFAHRAEDGTVMLDFDDESTGTQQLLELAIDASVMLRSGGTLLVDEIDASLHPMLTAKLIGLFQSRVSNPLLSQLIFTTHDATLLGNFDAEEVLARDQVWFTEKDVSGASTLYPLSDFKPRKEGENRQRRYLNGNYGGIPDLSADLFEQALAARGELDEGRA